MMNEKDYSKDLILYKNGKYKELKSYKKVKVGKVDSVLLSTKSSLYGYSYVVLKPNIYNKLKKISNIKFSYRFLDGELVDDCYDDETIQNLWVKNIYYYNDPRELLSKLYEIYMTEICLNENFWVFNSFYSYMFDDYKISFTYKTKKSTKRYKFKNIIKLYKFLFDDNSLLTKTSNKNSLISFTKNKYSLFPIKDLKNKSKFRKYFNKSNWKRFLIPLNNSQVVDIKPEFILKYNQIDVESKLYVKQFDDMTEGDVLYSYVQNNMSYKLYPFTEKQNNFIEFMYMIGCSPIIVRNLDSSNYYCISYHTKNKIKLINGKKPKNKKERNFNKLFKKYFPAIKYGQF